MITDSRGPFGPFGRKFESPVFETMGYKVYIKWHEEMAHITVFTEANGFHVMFMGDDSNPWGMEEAWAKVYQYVLGLE